jgi:hypothetical protein
VITTILDKTTEADESEEYSIGQAPDNYPAYASTIYLLGEAEAADEIKVQYPDGTSWRDTGWTLSLSTPVLTIFGPLDFRVSKSASTNALGVGIATQRGI